jgi:PAS domain S-box-containing protein
MSAEPSGKPLETNGPASFSETQFKKLVEVISRSQQNYRELIDNLDQAVFTLSLEGEIRVANRRLSEILGASFQELIGHRLGEFIESPTIREANEFLPKLVEKGYWRGVVKVRMKYGTGVHYLDCWLQALMEDNQIHSVVGWARGITSQHESEIRFTELFESLREGLIFTSLEGHVMDANPAMIRMLGYDTKEELKAVPFREVYEDPSKRDLLIRKLVESGSIQDWELVLHRKDGRKIHCLASGSVSRDPLGRVIRLQGTFVDITERIEMEKRLRQEQEFVRRLVASFPDVIGVLDKEGLFTFVSPRVEEVLGRPVQEVVGERFDARTHPGDRSKLEDAFQKVISGQVPNAQVEFRARHADGSWRTLRASAGPHFDEWGNISGAVASARDVTESKRLEQLLAEKDKFTAMGQMMAGAAHELNNPLTAILGVADLLRENAGDSATRRQVELVLEQARRAASIVQNLLVFSRPPTQGRTRVHLERVVQEVLEAQQTSLREKNIAVEFEMPDDLPLVVADLKQLTQVFSHLLTNAEQAISAVRNHGKVRILLARAGNRVSVTFADDGAGILLENIERIFHPFFTTKRPGGGTGLGLTICLAVIKEHGGSIEVQSKPGEGTSLRVLLPAVAERPLSAAGRLARAMRESSAESERLRGLSVLVIDDEETICEIIREGLAARGMSVETARNSEEALSWFEGNSCNIVLCDFNLPRMNGEGVLEHLRALKGGHAPLFVFMTGDLLDPDKVAELRKKDAWVLQKPFQVSMLVGLLTELVGRQPRQS